MPRQCKPCLGFSNVCTRELMIMRCISPLRFSRTGLPAFLSACRNSTAFTLRLHGQFQQLVGYMQQFTGTFSCFMQQFYSWHYTLSWTGSRLVTLWFKLKGALYAFLHRLLTGSSVVTALGCILWRGDCYLALLSLDSSNLHSILQIFLSLSGVF
jgi:hypothetical protein